MEREMRNKKKKELGAFYTPSHLAELITYNTIDLFLIQRVNYFTNSTYTSPQEIIAEGKETNIQKINDVLRTLCALDGATGDGQFLISVFKRIKEIRLLISERYKKKESNQNEIELEILNSNIFGMEIDSDSVLQCHKNLLKNIKKENIPEAQRILKMNIIRGNFLKSKHENWHNDSIQDQGFDIIIGNPPWGGKLTKDQKDDYYNLFALKCPKRNLNTSSLFVYQATKLLNPNLGILSFLLPKNIVRSNQYTFLREFILKQYKIINSNFYGLFKDVTQEFISLIAQRTKEVPKDHIVIIDEKIYIPQTAYLTNPDYIFTRTYDPHSQELLQLIQKESIPLSHFLTIYRGEELSKRGSVMFCPNCEKWVQLSSRKENIICPQCLKNLDKVKLKRMNLIQKEKDLDHNQPILTGDDFDHYKINAHHYIDSTINYRSKKGPKIYCSPKLVVQKIKRFPCAAFDSNGFWTTQNVYNLILTPEYEDKSDILFYILAVLNSSLYRWYYEVQFNLESNYTNAISIHNLRRLLIRKPDFSNPTFIQIIDKARSIAKLNLKINSAIIEEINNLILKYYNCENMLQPV